MGFHFAQLLLYEQCLKSRSAAVRESLILEMVHAASDIIKLAIETSDERTQHLSDHIYHVITFAAVSLCRIVHLYEDEVSSTLDGPSLDVLISNVVSWFRTIGLSCHVSRILAQIVSDTHAKLRGHARHETLQDVDTWSHSDFPLLFSYPMDAMVDGSIDFLPDWDPYLPEGA